MVKLNRKDTTEINSTNWFNNKKQITIVGESTDSQLCRQETVICYIKSAVACMVILSAQLFSDARMLLISDVNNSEIFLNLFKVDINWTFILFINRVVINFLVNNFGPFCYNCLTKRFFQVSFFCHQKL